MLGCELWDLTADLDTRLKHATVSCQIEKKEGVELEVELYSLINKMQDDFEQRHHKG